MWLFCWEMLSYTYSASSLESLMCTPVQALRLCTGRTAHRGSRGIALLSNDYSTRRGEGSASRSGRSLPRDRLGTHGTGGWVGPRASLDRCGKFHPQPGFDPRTVQPVAQSLYRLSWRHNHSCEPKYKHNSIKEEEVTFYIHYVCGVKM
jgi:hypothetical protein